MIFLSKKAFVIVIFSMLVSANLSAYERWECYIVRKMQISEPAVSIESEAVIFNDREISSELVLKNTSSKSVDAEVQIRITPLGHGVPFTEGLLPVNFSLCVNGKQHDFLIKYQNEFYTKEKAEQTNCYEDSFCVFSVKFQPDEQKKLNLKYQNDFIPFIENYCLFHIFSAEKNKTLTVFQSDEGFLIENFYESDKTDSEYIPQKHTVFTDVKRLKGKTDFYYQIDVPESTKVLRCDFDVPQFGIIVNKNPRGKNYGYMKFNDKNCSVQQLSKSDLFYLSKEQLSFLRNSFYACHGYIFKNKKFADRFALLFEGQGSSYPFNADFSESDFSEVEKANIALIKEMEK